MLRFGSTFRLCRASSLPTGCSVRWSSTASSPILLSPAVAHLLAYHKISLFAAESIPASGPKGRLLKGDILSFVQGESLPAPASQQGVAPTTTPPKAPSPTSTTDAYVDVETSNTRRVIADRLTQSKQSSPHLYMSCECPLDNLLNVRSALNDISETKISVNDMIVKALASALRDVPQANGGWDATRNDKLGFPSVDISVAVAVEGGLITPVVKAADTKGLSEIAGEIKNLAQRAKEGKLTPNEYQGGSATISNLGMFGVSEFSAVLNPPQGCILAVGGKQDKIVLGEDGRPKVSSFMTVTLSCDNRAIDEEVGAALLESLKHYIDVPGDIV